MRKLAVLVAVLASTAAWAASGGGRGEGGAGRAPDARHPAPRAMGTGSTQDTSQAGASERDALSKDDFNVKGKVGRVSARSVTIDRDGSTSATLMIDQATKIEVDGKAARATDIKPGDDVKASFNLRGERPIAVDLKADSKKK